MKLWTIKEIEEQRINDHQSYSAWENNMVRTLNKALDHIQELQAEFLELQNRYEQCETERQRLCR